MMSLLTEYNDVIVNIV